MIGYMIEQEMGNLLPFEVPFATILTQVEVDGKDPAFQNPTKPIGPVYSREEAERLAAEKGWSIAPDGDKFRRVVPSPRPKRIFEIRPVKWLLEKGTIVICAGGGGIPTMYDEAGKKLSGVEAVIDKDLCSSLLAQELVADILIIATDVDAAYVDWGKPTQKAIAQAHPDELERLGFAAGSMGPKVQAAIEFARATGKDAVIGSLADIVAITEARREHGSAHARRASSTADTPPPGPLRGPSSFSSAGIGRKVDSATPLRADFQASPATLAYAPPLPTARPWASISPRQTASTCGKPTQRGIQ